MRGSSSPAVLASTATPYRAHYGFTAELSHPVATGLVLSAVYLALSHWSLVAAVPRARRTGQLLKMSG